MWPDKAYCMCIVKIMSLLQYNWDTLSTITSVLWTLYYPLVYFVNYYKCVVNVVLPLKYHWYTLSTITGVLWTLYYPWNTTGMLCQLLQVCCERCITPEVPLVYSVSYYKCAVNVVLHLKYHWYALSTITSVLWTLYYPWNTTGILCQLLQVCCERCITPEIPLVYSVNYYKCVVNVVLPLKYHWYTLSTITSVLWTLYYPWNTTGILCQLLQVYCKRCITPEVPLIYFLSYYKCVVKVVLPVPPEIPQG